MPVRVTSALFVAALVRRVQAGGGFAYVIRRGHVAAGAVFVAFHRAETGGYDLFAPGPPDDAASPSGGRAFMAGRPLADAAQLHDFVGGEARFDPDFWLVEIENWHAPPGDLITIVE